MGISPELILFAEARYPRSLPALGFKGRPPTPIPTDTPNEHLEPVVGTSQKTKWRMAQSRTPPKSQVLAGVQFFGWQFWFDMSRCWLAFFLDAPVPTFDVAPHKKLRGKKPSHEVEDPKRTSIRSECTVWGSSDRASQPLGLKLLWELSPVSCYCSGGITFLKKRQPQNLSLVIHHGL